MNIGKKALDLNVGDLFLSGVFSELMNQEDNSGYNFGHGESGIVLFHFLFR